MSRARTKCFIDTVSPARNSVRSKTVCARTSGSLPRPVGTLKRHDSMPFCQLLKTKAVSTGAVGARRCAR